MKNLFTAIQDKKFKTVTERNKWIRAQKVKVKGSGGGHNYPNGEILDLSSAGAITISSSAAVSYISSIMRKIGTHGNSIYLNNLILVGVTVKDMQEEIKSLQQDKKDIDTEIKELKDKIAFVKEKGIKEFNEDVFKNWRILKEINANMDKLDSYDFAASLTKLIQG
jgi:hypothetical protein